MTSKAPPPHIIRKRLKKSFRFMFTTFEGGVLAFSNMVITVMFLVAGMFMAPISPVGMGLGFLFFTGAMAVWVPWHVFNDPVESDEETAP